MRVLEIGTGTGYNAALLLCERLGSDWVTSVDIDPQLVALARERLAANGYTPTLAAVDGARGYPAGAPYDRIIATCSVPAVPPAWLNQTTPGGMIMVDVRGMIGGTVARLTVGDDGTATGRFQPHYREFMPLRADADMFAPMRPRSVLSADAADSVSTLDPTLLLRAATPGSASSRNAATGGAGDLGIRLRLRRRRRDPAGNPGRLHRPDLAHPTRGRLPRHPDRPPPPLGPCRARRRAVEQRRPTRLRPLRHHRDPHRTVRLV